MSRGDMESRVRERIASWNRHDVAGFVRYYSDDATVYDPMYPEPLRGAAAVGRDFQEFITAFPDTEFMLGAVVVDHPHNPATTWHNWRSLWMLNPNIAAIQPVTIRVGSPLTLRYRVVVHDGDTPTAITEKLPRQWRATT